MFPTTTFRFIESPFEPPRVIEWIRALPTPPVETATPWGIALHFSEFGKIAHHPDGAIDAKTSPLAALHTPQVRRGIFWTVGEISFLPSPLGRLYPALHRLSKQFSKWLAENECVFSLGGKGHPPPEDSYNYYLEGSSKNRGSPVWALDSGLVALKAERYFVDHRDSDARLDKLCLSLRLRGVNCAGAPPNGGR